MSFGQNALIGKWTFSKMIAKDSTIFDLSDTVKTRAFFTQTIRSDLNDIADTSFELNTKLIDSTINQMASSFLRLNANKTFEITNIEILVPSIPGNHFTEKIIKGTWTFDEAKKILSLKTQQPFVYKYKVAKVDKLTLVAGLTFDESQQDEIQAVFKRHE